MTRPPDALSPHSVSPHFRLIFLTVVALTVGSILLALALAVLVPQPNDRVLGVYNLVLHLGEFGGGAIFGLLGGKSLQ